MFRLLLFSSVLTSVAILSGCGDGDSSGDGSSTAVHWKPEGAVLPTTETIEGGEYTPLSRPLFIYVNKASLSKPAVAAFLDYYISPEGQELAAETGYIKLNETQYAETKNVLTDAMADTGAEVPSGNITGDVIVDGSSTVAPISTAIAEEFSKKNAKARVPVGTSGTGGGFKKFINGETDINDASRPIKDSEAAACKEKGIEFVELKVAIDGLTVVVNPENDWCDGLSVEQLNMIWKPDSTVKNWSDVREDWPNEKIKLFGPDADSGTFDYFTEEINGDTGAIRTDFQPNTDDNFLVTGVAGDKYALGYFGYAYYVEAKNQVKALAIAPASEE